MCKGNWTPTTCQYIFGEVDKATIRRLGADALKCGDPVKEESPYCEKHHRICYVKVKAE